MSRKTIVAGIPQITPNMNLLNVEVCSPCTYNQMMLSILTNGSAANIPP